MYYSQTVGNIMPITGKLVQKPAAISVKNIPNKYIMKVVLVIMRGTSQGLFANVPPAIADPKSSLCDIPSNLFPVFFCQ